MTDLEKRRKGKIPGNDTNIEIRRSFCAICTGTHCGLDAYLCEGRVIKVEGTKDHPTNHGLLCTKGAANRGYLYREDRVLYPQKRTGPRGEGKFERITWDEAYSILRQRLDRIKGEYGADSVAFFSGYDKWHRPWLQRFAYDFGSVNYCSESSVCATASKLAWEATVGVQTGPDIGNTQLLLAWAPSGTYSRYLQVQSYQKLKDRGAKIIVVDPRITHISQRYADLHLRVRPGTDGLLANCIAGIILRNGWQDQAYIDRYAHGSSQYAAYVTAIDPAQASRITGVPVEQIALAAQWIGRAPAVAIASNPTSVLQKTNGFQACRAMAALSVITGSFDRKGGNTVKRENFIKADGGVSTREQRFATEKCPGSLDQRIGARRFPLWAKMRDGAQATDLPRQILEAQPYPIKGIFACGMNYQMFPESQKMLRALNSLDLFVDIDLFMTESAKYADLVLPACTSMEREEFKLYDQGYVKYYQPVIEPLGQSKSDVQILRELAGVMEFDDALLRSSYRECVEYIFQDSGVDLEAALRSELPVKVNREKAQPGEYLEKGIETATGKLELYSELIASCQEGPVHLDPLPVYEPSQCEVDAEEPYYLLTGVRIPNAIHTRLHKVPWARSLRPDPLANISLEDAKRLDIKRGDRICLFNRYGSIELLADPTCTVPAGTICIFHGYTQADASALLGADHLDPYSGFPNYKGGSCNMKKV